MKKDGYSLIELLVVMAIIAILAMFGIAAYQQFNKTQTLRQAAMTVKNDLRKAQTRAMASEKPPTSSCTILDGYQVTFTDSSYQVQAKCSPTSPGVPTSYNLPTGISFTSYPTKIVFKVLGQGVDITGSNIICISGFNKLYKITVTTGGEIKYEENVGSCL